MYKTRITKQQIIKKSILSKHMTSQVFEKEEKEMVKNRVEHEDRKGS